MSKTMAKLLPIDAIRSFTGHPFQVRDDEEMEELAASIQAEGLLEPILVRPLEGETYEVISGHRRVRACKRAGIQQIPALIRTMDRDAATIAMVDSNLHREHILPSEKAFAYKMKMEALSHQGITSGQLGQKWTRDEISEKDSGRQVQRYIRLTNLIPGILQMVDTGEIALTPGESLSYLTKREQQDLLEAMDSEDCKPSLSQAQQLKQLSQTGQLSMDMIFEVMSRQKQKEKIKIDYETVRKYFPPSYSPRDVQTAILKLVEQDFCRRQRQRDAR